MEHRLLLLVLGLCCVQVIALEIKIPAVPSISTVINRITNTTFGLVRGGINVFTRTIDRIVSTFGRVEDRLRQLLEEIRQFIVRGIPELSIPILDPLHIDKIEFDIKHDAARMKGTAEDVTVKRISKFVIDKVRFRDLGNLRFLLNLNLTFPYLTIGGKYDINGMVDNEIPIFGDGKFWLYLIDFKLAIAAIIEFDYPQLKLTSLSINIKLGKLENYFENLMHDKEIGELFNKALSLMAPEALDLFWPNMKKPTEEQIKKYVNTILENTTIADLARRLFNIR